MSTSVRAFLTVLMLLVFSVSQASDKEPKTLGWEDLMPKDWTPQFSSSISNFLDHNGTAAEQSLDAPVIESLDNTFVKIPGFMLPLEFNGQEVTEFLLVPYVGACIHVPPPPANQVVYVKLEKPWVSTDLYDPVWVEGMMQVESIRSLYAEAAYTIQGLEVTKYEW